ncbi:MAG: MaoC/PaaZ C-terminal domain-containing protein [Gammaproteobacteria bacterium]
MPIVADELLAREFAPTRYTYGARELLLYALGVGVGFDPTDEAQLPFVYEKALRPLPTLPTCLPYVSIRTLDLGIDYAKTLHGEQSTVLHAPLPTAATVIGSTRVSSLFDKGAGKGALVYLTREYREEATGTLLATTLTGLFARGDGGFGGPAGPAPAPHPIPERAPDCVCELPTVPQAALIYRLNGDPNPLHAEPEVARRAGYDRPILHGLATYGLVGHALLRAVCGYDEKRVRSIAGRFSAPVFPGETIRTEFWIDGAVVSLRASVPARDAVVFNNGRAEIAG